MKKMIKAVVITILLMFFAVPLTVFAEDTESSGAGIKEGFNEILDESETELSYDDIGGLTFSGIAEKVGERLPDLRTRPMRLLGTILLMIVLSAAVRSIGGDLIKSGDNIFNSVSVLAAVTIIVPYLMEVYEQVLTGVRVGGDFVAVFIPVFTGFVTFKCTLAGKADGAATKTTRMVISGIVPVVGGAVSDAYATVRSSFDIVRGTVGTGGCIAVVLIILPPVIQVLAVRLVMWIGSAAAELFEEKAMQKLLDSLDSGLAIAQSVLVCYGVMFVICTGILMQTVG